MEAGITISKESLLPFDSTISFVEASPDAPEKWVPKSHPDDQRAEIYWSAGKIDESGMLRGEFRFQKFQQAQRKAIHAEWIKKRPFGGGSYTWKDFIHHLNHQGCRGLIPEIEKVVFIGSKFREILETTGYLHKVQEKILGDKIERRDRRYFCHDYDIRVYFKEASSKQLMRIKVVAKKYFQGCLGENGIDWRRAGGLDSDFLRYFMLPVQEQGHLDTEWLFIAKITREYLFTEDRIQGQITEGKDKFPQITLMGKKEEFYQGIIDSDRGVQRLCDAKNADYYAWIRLIVNRSFGKILEFSPGQDSGMIRTLQGRTIDSKQLPRKVYKSLKGLADHKLCIFWNAFISLKEYGGCEEVIKDLWLRCQPSLTSGCLENPLLKTLWSWISESKITFDELTIVMQVLALFREEATVRKDGGRPILFFDFGNSASIQFPMVTEETLEQFRLIVAKNSVSLEELFEFTSPLTLDPFFEGFIEGERFRNLGQEWIETKPNLGLAFLFIGRLISPKMSIGPIESAPYLLSQAKNASVQEMVRQIHDEGIHLCDDRDIVQQYVHYRMVSPDEGLFLWARTEWKSWDVEKRKKTLVTLCRQLKKQRPEALLRLIVELSRQMDPADGVRFLQGFTSKFQERERELFTESLNLIQSHSLKLNEALVSRLVRKLEKDKDYVSEEHFGYLVSHCPDRVMTWKNIFVKQGHSILEFVQTYPEIEEEFISQLNELRRLDREVIQFLLENPTYIARCESYCRKIFQKSPKAWVQSLGDHSCRELVQLTQKFLVHSSASKSVNQAWQIFIRLLDATSLLECAEALDGPSCHTQTLIKVEIECLRFVQSGTVDDYETIKRISERAVNSSTDRLRLNAWRGAYPAILKALHGRDPEMMLHYWSRSYRTVGDVGGTYDLLASCISTCSSEELEDYLMTVFKNLSQDHKEALTMKVLPERIQKQDRKQALSICQLAGSILGEKSTSIQLAVEYGHFDHALEFFKGEKDESELWVEFIQSCVNESQYKEALALLLQKWKYCAHLEPLLLKILSDKEVQTSDSALQDLLVLASEATPNAVALFENLAKCISADSSISVMQTYWQTFMQKVYEERASISKKWVIHLMKLVAKSNPAGLSWFLEEIERFKGVDDDFLQQYHQHLFLEIETLPPKEQDGLLSAYFRANHRFDLRLVDIDPMPAAALSLKFDSTRKLGLSLFLRVIQTRTPSECEIAVLISEILKLETIAETSLVVLLELTSLLIDEEGNMTMLEGIDFPLLFGRMFDAYLKCHVKITESSFECLVVLPKKFSYWEWFGVFLKAAFVSDANLGHNFSIQAKLFLQISLQFHEGKEFQEFIQEVLQSGHCNIDVWKILVSAFTEYVVSDSAFEARIALSHFDTISDTYAEWRAKIPLPVKYELFNVLHGALVLKWLGTEARVVEKEYEQLSDLFFEGESPMMQNLFLMKIVLQVGSVACRKDIQDFFMRQLLLCFSKFMVQLPESIKLLDDDQVNKFWSQTLDICKAMKGFRCSCERMIFNTFLRVEEAYKLHCPKLKFEVKVSLLSTIIGCSCTLLTPDPDEDLFQKNINRLQALFSCDRDTRVIQVFGALLPLQLPSIRERFEASFQHVFNMVYQMTIQMIDAAKKRKSCPTVYETFLLVNFLSLDCEDKKELQVAVRESIPPKWDQSLIELFHSDDFSDRYSVRMQCLELLQNKSSTALYREVRDEIYKTFQDNPRDWRLSVFPVLMMASYNASAEILTTSPRKKFKGYSREFSEHVDRFKTVVREFDRRVKSHSATCREMGLDPFETSAWVSSKSPEHLEMYNKSREFYEEGVFLFKQIFHFIHLSLQRISVLNQKRSVTELLAVHLKILKFLQYSLAGMDATQIIRTEFLRLILSLSCTYNSIDLHAKYYDLIREALVKAKKYDGMSGRSDRVTTMLKMLQDHQQYLGMLKLASPTILKEATKMILRFVELVKKNLAIDIELQKDVEPFLQKPKRVKIDESEAGT